VSQTIYAILQYIDRVRPKETRLCDDSLSHSVNIHAQGSRQAP
jgi:hypothetical protein